MGARGGAWLVGLVVVGSLMLGGGVGFAQDVHTDTIRDAIERGANTGPFVESFGRVFTTEDPGLAFSPDGRSFKLLFESYSQSPSPERVNRGIDSVARFLNMNGKAGVRGEELDVVLIIHGNAAYEALGNQGYRDRFEMDNPNLPLLEELSSAGVRIYVCAQSAAGRGLEKRELAASVDIAFSAMNALVDLQDDGYALISRDWAVR